MKITVIMKKNAHSETLNKLLERLANVAYLQI